MTTTLLSPRGRFLVLLLLVGPSTRVMLEESMGLSDKSVERILVSLETAGLVASQLTRVGGPKWWSVKDGIEVAEVLLQDAQSGHAVSNGN